MRRDQSARRQRALALALVCVGPLAGCSPPAEVALAREEPRLVLDAGQPANPEAAAPDADAAVKARDRVRVINGELRTDRGSLLRGVTVAPDEYPNFVVDRALFDQLKAAGLNALHVYLENWNIATGLRVAQADTIVSLAAAAGVYVVFGLGAGSQGARGGPGQFDIEKVRSFWYYYAGRFAEQTHVLFEVHNYPEPACKGTWPTATLAMEREAYQIIRRLAPQSHILLMSYGSMPTTEALNSAVDSLTGVDWSNASIAAHDYADCVPLARHHEVIEAARLRGIPILITEVNRDSPADVSEYELARAGWVSTRWLIVSQDWTSFRHDHGPPAATWCPDFGIWPQDSAVCSPQ
jgi:hypothetical protein